MLVITFTAHAQQYIVRHFSIQDGLSHDNVYYIFQDKKGFLWFCTDYGLTEYNGQTFNSTFYDKNGLLNGALMSVYEAGGDTLFINSYRNGLLTLANSRVKKYPLQRGQFPPFSLKALPLAENIWVLGKPALYEITHGAIKAHTVTNSEGQEIAFTNMVENDNDLLFCGSNGIYHVNHNVVEPYLKTYVSDAVIDICRDKHNNLWIAYRNHIQKITNGKPVCDYRLPAKQVIKDILCDSHDKLWIALDGDGMLLIENDTMTDITSALPMSKTVVNNMLEDNEGNIWMATYGAGVFKIISTEEFSYQPAGSNIYCKTLCGYGNGRILIGSVGKVSLWEDGRIKPFPVRLLTSDEYIYFIQIVGDKMYIGTSLGLIIKDTKNGTEQHIKHSKYLAATSLCSTSQGKILIGGYMSLMRVEGNRLIADTPGIGALVNRYNAIYCGHGNRILYATDKGILIADSASEALPLPMLPELRINDVLEDNQNRIWAATDNGLAYYYKNKWTIIKNADGLSSNKCNKLLLHGNQLFVGTLTGLSIIDLRTTQVHKCAAGIDRDDILSLYCEGNRLFAGTINKLVSFNLDRLIVDEGPPPVYITYARTPAQLFNMPVKLSLAYNQNKLTIGFIAVSYREPGKIEYRYKFDGLYNSWYTTNNATIEFSALPPGDYTFVLNARKNDGRWSKDIVLPIHVEAPFWKTWWFIILAITAGIVCIAVSVKLYEQKRRRQLLLFNKVVYLKQQALSALINPHFIFNCMNSIQYYLDNNESDKANSYLSDFALLIRMTLEDAQKAYISIEKEVERVKLYLSLEQLRFGDELEYEIVIHEPIKPHSIFIPNMILQPYIENAIWHGIMPQNGKGLIRVSFQEQAGNEIQIIITDNGVGISNTNGDTAKQGDGHYGMALTSQRLQLLKQISGDNYSVQVGPMEEKGTRVVITVAAKLVDAVPNDEPETI